MDELSVYQRAGGIVRARFMFVELVYVEWVKNKVLLDSTGNSIQYLVRNHNGKACEKEFMCITKSLCYTAEMNTML